VHFTESAEQLKGILSIGFKVKYCRERILFGDTEKVFRLPVVSFCDIPISEAEENKSKYGSYALGLTEDWAIEKGLTPVIYLQRYSHLAESLLKSVDLVVENEIRNAIESNSKLRSGDSSLSLLDAFLKFPKENEFRPMEEDPLMNALDVIRYTKNYIGTLIRREGDPILGYYFADEREWRYALKTKHFHQFICMDDMANSDGIAVMMQRLIDNERLLFSSGDIRYIIIKREEERSDIEGHIQSLTELFTEEEMENLLQKIYTFDQITKVKGVDSR